MGMDEVISNYTTGSDLVISRSSTFWLLQFPGHKVVLLLELGPGVILANTSSAPVLPVDMYRQTKLSSLLGPSCCSCTCRTAGGLQVLLVLLQVRRQLLLLLVLEGGKRKVVLVSGV